MDVRKFFLGEAEFEPANEISRKIRESKNFDPKSENPEQTQSLLIFQTSKQQTWLVASRARLYCILDDVNRSFTRVQWSMEKNELVSGRRVTVTISVNDKSPTTGTVDIGDHKAWLYSKKLFPQQDMESRIRQLILQQMNA